VSIELSQLHSFLTPNYYLFKPAKR